MTSGRPVHTALCPILNEVVKAAEGGFPFLALTMAVALPEICASLASPDGRAGNRGEHYKAWCNANLPKEHFQNVTAEDLYSMRCGILHNGRIGDLKNGISRVIFSLPSAPNFRDCQIQDAYFYSVATFCKILTDAVHVWMEKNHQDPNVQKNLKNLMQYRNDLPPYIKSDVAFIA